MNSQWGLETVLEFNKNSAKKDLNNKGLNLVVRCLAKGTPELMIRALQVNDYVVISQGCGMI